MRRMMWAALLLTIAVVGVLAQGVGTDVERNDREHTQWIEHVMASLSTIKPGMTRKDLARLVVQDGGLGSRSQGRYLYRHCADIKIDIQFAAADEGPDWSPEDRVVKVSRPYLEYPTFD